jgi:hypothetical protein
VKRDLWGSNLETLVRFVPIKAVMQNDDFVCGCF